MPNALINESSPYLLQHANNPVDWHAWNPETLQKAKDENKMLLISIGYAACHWCHVMEHECFENKQVAKLMNENFVCIKVDREERPDVDQVYMNAAYLINGNGGWPLNALAMPDGKPFFAGTYFPRENWIRLLEYFAGIYKNEREKLEEQAENVSKGIREIEHIPINPAHLDFDKKDVDEMFSVFENRIDFELGGTKGAMKFPMPSVWEFLLQYHYFSENKKALEAVETTLKKMANGGIYDQLGGGFARYATDSKWHVPHFEKMLYDNGQLVSFYSHAYQLTKNPLYKKVVYETLDFVNRELASPQGGFYSSLDADSEGEEGKYYVWTEKQLKEILQDDSQLYIDHFGITESGNWEEGKNIPDRNFGKAPGAVNEQINERLFLLNKKLLQERQKRIRPATDDKILVSWNALMSIGFIDAYRAFGEDSFYKIAEKNLQFVIKNLCTEENHLYRNYKNGKPSIHGFLDDYAFLISALISFYQVSFDESYLQKAKALTEYVQFHFFDEQSGMFLYTDNQYHDLIARKMEVTDNVIPSSNSEVAKNLFVLSLYFEESKYEKQARQMIKNVFGDVKKNIGYYSNWAMAANMQIYQMIETAIVGREADEKRKQLQQHYLPNVIYSGSMRESTLVLLQDKYVKDKTMIYVCRNKTCDLPVQNSTQALEQIEK
ncbi:MAG TPA: thioredoxin domain-containing protein [Hanamia sp.]|nr:thioredoxin domain-containing protein [Hanamia sp.]